MIKRNRQYGRRTYTAKQQVEIYDAIAHHFSCASGDLGSKTNRHLMGIKLKMHTRGCKSKTFTLTDKQRSSIVFALKRYRNVA